MRNLTIKRNKTFVGCAVKLKVYIEDNSSNELTISGVPCKKLGVIKNGEEKTFEISDESLKVFVIADTISKEYCNEFYQIPEGTEDIRLEGKNKFSPFQGNPFRFENNNDLEAISNRKKGSKKGVLLTIICAIVGFIIGFVFVGMLM